MYLFNLLGKMEKVKRMLVKFLGLFFSWEVRKVIDISEHCLFAMLNVVYALFYLILTITCEV